ncbi:MAG: histidine kinase [Chitinophagaceae bacterium]|nr:MAG: histidine kinase [Chitinophagaceae bacterium]
MLLLYAVNMTAGNYDISFSEFLFYGFVPNLCVALTSIFTVLILATTFKRKISTGVKTFLVLYFLGLLIIFFFESNIANPVTAIAYLLISSLCIYYTISSWKSLRGAQWSIVAGLFLGLLCGIIYFILISVYNHVSMGTIYFLITGYSLAFPLSLLIYVSMRFKEIINDVRQNAAQVVKLSEEKEQQALNQQNILQAEVKKQTAEISNALEDLKSTQSKLIQSEKMASLGELTAGIAHEIQNPLNFINNFSDVNTELIAELKTALVAGDTEEAIAIADDIRNNEQKINHHGRRADSIVKNMLQHSRQNNDQKELTDVNALTDEYLRLSYHGLRAKDKSFNAVMETHYDTAIGKIELLPQDIGRVLLNLFTNAFYSVQQKKGIQGNSFEPKLFISTSKVPGGIEISVKDNGMGIPQKVLDKIYQPFFTTKPTGEGTGLGLSMSYDIITKAHGGTLKARTAEGEFAEFIIFLPA